ncbi:MAG: EutN/CcmL family microcompartment protein [Candidatus Eremiobacteraeota bacterium]|nr:EutN/CcmL family microcompartment protein [Candidatus Eremiobacteraeota bacterium]
MKLARVVGNIWATRKATVLKNKRMLLVQPMDPISGKTHGKVMMALCDKIDAGIGDVVLVMDEGSSAGQVLGINSRPVRTFIFGIVDELEKDGNIVKYT